MADFPSLSPQTRTYIPGSYAVRRANTLAGGQVAVRKNNAATDYYLSLTFISDSVDDQNKIFTHFASQNRFQPFDIPSVVLENGGFSFPSGYQWIYRDAPRVTYEPDKITVNVELELVAPYDI